MNHLRPRLRRVTLSPEIRTLCRTPGIVGRFASVCVSRRTIGQNACFLRFVVVRSAIGARFAAFGRAVWRAAEIRVQQYLLVYLRK